MRFNVKSLFRQDGSAIKKTSFGSGRAHESEDDSSVWQLPRSGHRSHLNFTDIKTKGKKSRLNVNALTSVTYCHCLTDVNFHAF